MYYGPLSRGNSNSRKIIESKVNGNLRNKSLRAKEVTYFGTRLHNETENTIGSTADSETTHQLVTEGFTLGDGAETTVRNLDSIFRIEVRPEVILPFQRRARPDRPSSGIASGREQSIHGYALPSRRGHFGFA